MGNEWNIIGRGTLTRLNEIEELPHGE